MGIGIATERSCSVSLSSTTKDDETDGDFGTTLPPTPGSPRSSSPAAWDRSNCGVRGGMEDGSLEVEERGEARVAVDVLDVVWRRTGIPGTGTETDVDEDMAVSPTAGWRVATSRGCGGE